jgi:hypothetical protein
LVSGGAGSAGGVGSGAEGTMADTMADTMAGTMAGGAGAAAGVGGAAREQQKKCGEAEKLQLTDRASRPRRRHFRRLRVRQPARRPAPALRRQSRSKLQMRTHSLLLVLRISLFFSEGRLL